MTNYNSDTLTDLKDMLPAISGSGSDTQLIRYLDRAYNKMNQDLTPYTSVPLSGAGVTDRVKELESMLAACMYIRENVLPVDDAGRPHDHPICRAAAAEWAEYLEDTYVQTEVPSDEPIRHSKTEWKM